MIGSWLLYYLVIIPISRLPYPLLYAFSDFACFVLYRIVGYRKAVVRGNLQRSFPEKSEAELLVIEKKFYSHFVDLVVESLKNFTISSDECQRRMRSVNPELLNRLYDEGRPVTIAGAHYNNWELWALGAATPLKHPLKGIYKRLSNKFFDEKMRESRGRFGMQLVSTQEVKNHIDEIYKGPSAVVYASDQSPGNPKSAYWMTFLNQDTACFFGPERHAKMFNTAVVYGHQSKIKRGFYEVEYKVIFEHPGETEYGEITEKLGRLVEEKIIEQPEYWLWTHKRWKHKRPETVKGETTTEQPAGE